jgi:hypothetical protein
MSQIKIQSGNVKIKTLWHMSTFITSVTNVCGHHITLFSSSAEKSYSVHTSVSSGQILTQHIWQTVFSICMFICMPTSVLLPSRLEVLHIHHQVFFIVYLMNMSGQFVTWLRFKVGSSWTEIRNLTTWTNLPYQLQHTFLTYSLFNNSGQILCDFLGYEV